MARLAGKLHIRVGRIYLLLNRASGPLPEPLQQAIAETGLELLETIPLDPVLAEFDSTGRPIAELPDTSVAYQTVRTVTDRLLNGR
jgi:CO dehydrogenase maturation factor